VTLLQLRAEKDAFFASSQSPLPLSLRTDFRGLRYYPENVALRFSLPLEPDESREATLMPTTTGSERVYQRLGWVTFTVASMNTPTTGARLALYVLEGELEPSQVFVPFRDATSGKETYGGGRYLEAEISDGFVTLDFNLAYSPYCAYSEGWSCPIPPRENQLEIPIEAGEKNLQASGLEVGS
jgi:uncharacterized protein